MAPRSRIMALRADRALEAGGQATGVITESLAADHEIAHGGLARLNVVRDDAREKNPHGPALGRLRHVAKGLLYVRRNSWRPSRGANSPSMRSRAES